MRLRNLWHWLFPKGWRMSLLSEVRDLKRQNAELLLLVQSQQTQLNSIAADVTDLVAAVGANDVVGIDATVNPPTPRKDQL